MVTTLIPLTLHLAQAIGLYLVLVGLSALLAPARWQRVMDEFAASAALPLVTGVFAFCLGATLIYVHCILADPLAVIVTAVGWIALVEGAALITVPQLLMPVGHWSMRFTRVWAVFSLVAGLLLALAGLTGRAG